MIKILVVDDDAYIRRLVSTILKDAGFEVYEAADGRDALLKLDEKRIDLCVADIMMPNMDGLEFCRNARNYYNDMPILMLTAKSEIGSKIATISAPISGMMDEKSVSLGQNVDSGTILGKVKNTSPINAVIEVKQTNLEDIKVGQKAKVTIGERDPLVYEGTLKSINGSADPSSRVFKGQIQLDNPDQALKPGSFAKAEIVNDQKVEIATVPLAALAGNEDSCYLFVNDQGIARKRSVIIGETEENVVVIKSGVQKGESVICTNVNTLQDGDVIEVVAE